jgi:hypothetical protein
MNDLLKKVLSREIGYYDIRHLRLDGAELEEFEQAVRASEQKKNLEAAKREMDLLVIENTKRVMEQQDDFKTYQNHNEMHMLGDNIHPECAFCKCEQVVREEIGEWLEKEGKSNAIALWLESEGFLKILQDAESECSESVYYSEPYDRVLGKTMATKLREKKEK